MLYPEEQKYFAEDVAVFIDKQSNPRFKTIDLFRLFPASRDNLQVSGPQFLDDFTSTFNQTQIEAGTKIDYVDNPTTNRGKDVHAGRWRLVSNKQFKDPTDPNLQGILQHLRLYATTTVLASAGVIDWSLARVVDLDTSPGNDQTFGGLATVSANPAKLLIVEWAAVHPSKVSAVIDEFRAAFTTATAFTIDNQAFAAGMSYIFTIVKDVETDKDGVKSVRFVLGRPEFVLKYQGNFLSRMAYTGWMLWDIPKAQAQTLIDQVIAGTAQGISIMPEYDSAAHTVNLRLRKLDSLIGEASAFWGGDTCLQTQTVTVYSGYTKAALQALLLALAGSVGAGVWFEVSSIRELEEDGLWSCQVTRYDAVRVVQAAHTTQASAAGTASTERVFNSKTPETELATARVAGTIVQRAWNKNPNCTTDVQRTILTPIDQTIITKEEAAARSVARTVHTEAEDPLADPVQTAGVIKRVENAQTEAGNVRTTQEDTTPHNQTDITKETSFARTISRQVDTELSTALAAAIVSPPLPVVGEINRVEKADTEVGNVRVTQEKTTPINQTAVSGVQDATKTVVSTLETERASVETPASSAGVNQRVEAAPTEAGQYRHVKEVTTSRKQTVISGEDSLAQSVTRTVIEKDDGFSAGAPTAAAGTLKRVTATPTEFVDRPDVVEEVTTPKQRTVTEGAADAFKTTLVTLKTQELAAEPVPTQADGLVKSSRNVPTPTGFQTEKTEITAVAQDTGLKTIAYSDDSVTTEQKFHNADALPDAVDEANAETRVTGDINEFHKYDYVSLKTLSRVPASCATPVTWVTYGWYYWQTVTTMYPGDVYDKTYVSGIQQQRKVYTHTLSYHLTAAAAAAAIGTGNGTEGSSIAKAGAYLWQAHRIVTSLQVAVSYTFAYPQSTYTATRNVYAVTP